MFRNGKHPEVDTYFQSVFPKANTQEVSLSQEHTLYNVLLVKLMLLKIFVMGWPLMFFFSTQCENFQVNRGMGCGNSIHVGCLLRGGHLILLYGRLLQCI